MILISGITQSLVLINSMLTSLICFYLYNVFYEDKLEISQVYSLIVIFAWISIPIRNSVHCFNRRVQGYTTSDRLAKLARLPEIKNEKNFYETDSNLRIGEIVIEKADFLWEDPELKSIIEEFELEKTDKEEDSKNEIELKPLNGLASPEKALTDVNLHIKPGTITLVLGRVGSGKTTFLRALLD